MQCVAIKKTPIPKEEHQNEVARKAGRGRRGVGNGGAAGAARGEGDEGAGDGLGVETGHRKALARGARCASIFFEGAVVGDVGGGGEAL